MGLFSSSSKNKPDRAAEDSGRFYSKDDDAAELGERARSKRASSAGGAAKSTRRAAADPLLPEKKRARRRLVGAIALALAAAVGLPMLLDSEPKPLAGDIAIQIPGKEKAAPLAVPGDKAVSAEESVDKGEEVVAPPADKPASTSATRPAPVTAPVNEPAPVARVEAPKPAEHTDKDKERADARLAEKAEKAEKAEREKAAKAEKAEKLAKAKAEERAAEKAAQRIAADKAVKAREDARALAILEDKAAEKADRAEKAKAPDAAAQKFVLQVAALSSQEKAAEVQARLSDAGISSYTQKANTASGELIRVRVGPLTREEAEKVRAKLGKLGLSGTMTPV